MQTHERQISLREAFRMIKSEGGVRAFYKGFGPAIVRSFPANAVIMATYNRLSRRVKSALD